MAICGKFRGEVLNNRDPQQIGRLEVSVPDVQGGITGWALPCLPYAGPDVGFFACPPIGANVWVEFEGGDVESPIWTGCFWEGDAPAGASDPEIKTLTIPGVSLTLSDSDGLKIELVDGTRVRVSGTKVAVENAAGARLVLQGPKVSINGNALEVI